MNHELLIITILGLTTFIFSIVAVHLMVANERLKRKYAFNREFAQKEILLSAKRFKLIIEQQQLIGGLVREIGELNSRILKAKRAGYPI